MYSYEEEDDEKALELIKEVIHMNPRSYFPYNLLGEIYSKQKKWQLASDAFLKSISIQPSNETYHNLAIARYHLRDVKEASDYFLRIAGNSDSAMYSHVKCLIELGKKTEAREKPRLPTCMLSWIVSKKRCISLKKGGKITGKTLIGLVDLFIPSSTQEISPAFMKS